MLLRKIWNLMTVASCTFLLWLLFYLHKVKLKPKHVFLEEPFNEDFSSTARSNTVIKKSFVVTTKAGAIASQTMSKALKTATVALKTATVAPKTVTTAPHNAHVKNAAKSELIVPKATLTETKNNKTIKRTININHVFKRIEEIETHRNLCLEKSPTDDTTMLVVYDANESVQRHIETVNGRSVFRVSWPVTFRLQRAPETHRMLDAHAYFINNAHYGNLHHIFADALEVIYRTLKTTGDLQAEDDNPTQDIYLLTPTYDYKTRRNETTLNRKRRRLSFFFYSALGVTYYDTYVSLPPNTCFRRATFSRTIKPPDTHELEQVLKGKIGIDKETCRDVARPRVVIQLRHYRTILNGDELADMLTREFNASVLQVYFEDLSVKHQITLVHCADLLIGIHGAGLEHFRFMQPRSALIQIGWPHWEATYLYDIPPKLKMIRAQKLNNCSASISEKAWALYYKQNPEVQNKTRPEILELAEHLDQPSFRENIWKYADCHVDVEQVRQIANGFGLYRKRLYAPFK